MKRAIPSRAPVDISPRTPNCLEMVLHALNIRTVGKDMTGKCLPAVFKKHPSPSSVTLHRFNTGVFNTSPMWTQLPSISRNDK